MKITTICFLLEGDKVLLAMKKRGFGVGKWNGVGGKVNDGEDIPAAAIREIHEEIDVAVDPQELEPFGTLSFSFQDNPDWDNFCHIFIVQNWRGDPAESEEMRPECYPIGKLPFETMWVDDPQWLPRVLAGEKIQAKFFFDKNGANILNSSVTSVMHDSQPPGLKTREGMREP